MVIVVARVALHLSGAQSLKDKRQVMHSLLTQVRRRFSVAAAETDEQDRWQIGVVGLVCVTNSAAHGEEVIAKAVDFVAGRKFEAEMLDYQTEVIHAF